MDITISGLPNLKRLINSLFSHLERKRKKQGKRKRKERREQKERQRNSI